MVGAGAVAISCCACCFTLFAVLGHAADTVGEMSFFLSNIFLKSCLVCFRGRRKVRVEDCSALTSYLEGNELCESFPECQA